MDESLMPKSMRQKNDAPTPRAKKVVQGTVRVNKPGIKKLIKSIFLAEDVNSIREYIIWDRLVPAFRDGLYDVAMGTIGMMLYGKIIGSGKPRFGSRSNRDWDPNVHFSYDRPDDRRVKLRRDDTYDRRRTSNRVPEIAVESITDAQAALSELVSYMSQYDRVPVSAYYDAFGVTSNRLWTDEKWGWTSLADACIVPANGGGFTISLPEPEPFE